jgi:acyl carrier protein
MVGIEDVKRLVAEVLGVEDRMATFHEDTPLAGGLPEFDSMAVVSVITAIEETYGVTVEDDDISAETFATFGSVRQFVNRKVEH